MVRSCVFWHHGCCTRYVHFFKQGTQKLNLSPGIDEGLISGTLAKADFSILLGLDVMSVSELANVKGNISAMVQIGSVGGAAL
jgi:hypothetical protein